ncbi:uncharacterized protein LOC129582918 [Paramacrobiotus metropolitanus]|uniref:uncharacterized protein LOC129582918 n=1 Tax=Paramacrobiotus metropolitanus TaxID=2943436 RepID=UPI002445E77F|nr:uncharacterized protein LOC129582918 [Paramacrobiotus metropolitanus]
MDFILTEAEERNQPDSEVEEDDLERRIDACGIRLDCISPRRRIRAETEKPRPPALKPRTRKFSSGKRVTKERKKSAQNQRNCLKPKPKKPVKKRKSEEKWLSKHGPGPFTTSYLVRVTLDPRSEDAELKFICERLENGK